MSMAPTSRRPAVPATLLLHAVVLSQFTEITLTEISGVKVTAQQLLTAAALLYWLLWCRSLRIPTLVAGLAATLWAGGAAWYLVNGRVLDPVIMTLTMQLGISAAVYGLLAGFMKRDQLLVRLATLWTRWGVITAIIGVGQAIRLVPLLFVGGEAHEARALFTTTIYRGVGLQYDPNFQAVVLCLALVFARLGVRDRRLRFGAYAVISAGVVATFSRAGVVIAALALVASLWSESTARRRAERRLQKIFLPLVVLALGVTILGAFLTDGRAVVAERVEEIAVDANLIAEYGSSLAYASDHITSGQARFLLLHAAISGVQEHWLIGIGAGQSANYIAGAVGLMNVAHNTYVELLLSSGVLLGLAAWMLWLQPLHSLLRRRWRLPGSSSAGARMRLELAIAIYGVFLLAFCFLSMHALSVFFLPVAVGLGALDRARQAEDGSSVQPPKAAARS